MFWKYTYVDTSFIEYLGSTMPLQLILETDFYLIFFSFIF